MHATNSFTSPSWHSTMLKDSTKNFVKLFPQKIIIIQLYFIQYFFEKKINTCHILIEIDRSLPGETTEDMTIVLFKINSIKFYFIRFHFCLNLGLELKFLWF